MPDAPLPREELRATIEARRDLGPEYEAALTDAFLDRIEATIAQRVKAEADSRLPDTRHTAWVEQQERKRALGMALGSLGIALPLTGAAGATGGMPGMIVAWAGIVAVNMAYAFGRRRRG
ncbi:hypothetical protein [Microtetraspora sp. NBRC 16547]|uniref:hypothetical protein n=1 Tax=Microtetraspora sp. NBRC 16547 TaxID=3030993 RepID=UPI0024A0126D|nr:hypothetical protein [Microtetraspora sp. NBRC 16547]GLW99809.1 hypothetical protein Misp02_38960 [Microtetraspora sp. NBRC 16547]